MPYSTGNSRLSNGKRPAPRLALRARQRQRKQVFSQPEKTASVSERRNLWRIGGQQLGMTCQYPYLSFGPHRAEPRHRDLRHSAVARIQKAVFTRLEENLHGDA